MLIWKPDVQQFTVFVRTWINNDFMFHWLEMVIMNLDIITLIQGTNDKKCFFELKYFSAVILFINTKNKPASELLSWVK